MEHNDPRKNALTQEARAISIAVTPPQEMDDAPSQKHVKKKQSYQWNNPRKPQTVSSIVKIGLDNLCAIYSFLHPDDFLIFMLTSQDFYAVGVCTKRNLLIAQLAINPLLSRIKGMYDHDLLSQLCIIGEMPKIAHFLFDCLRKEAYRSKRLQTHNILFAPESSPFYAFLTETQKKIKAEEQLYDEFDETTIAAAGRFSRDEKIMLIHAAGASGASFLYLMKGTPLTNEITQLYCTWENVKQWTDKEQKELTKGVQYIIINAKAATEEKAIFSQWCQFHPQVMPIFIVDQEVNSNQRFMAFDRSTQFIVNAHSL